MKRYLCKSSSPFEEDPNPWLGEEEKKEKEKEEEGAVKDYFLNITNHHTKVMGDGEIVPQISLSTSVTHCYE